MDQWILNWDYKLLKLINETATTEWLDKFFPWLTDLNQSRYFGLILVSILLFFFYKKYKRTGFSVLLFLFLTLAFNDFIGAQIKNHYLRLRPFQNTEIHVIQKSPADAKSFYSNHASNSFAFATYTSIFFPLAQIPLFFIAFLVGYSRIYNGVHYPSDVIAGAIVGIFWGVLFAKISWRLFLRNKKDPS